MQIYLPSYKWVLENVPSVQNILEKIAKESQNNDIVFLDYNTNLKFYDLSSPLSHAGLVKLYIEGDYPDTSKKYAPILSKTEEKKSKTEKMKESEVSLFDDSDF
jgi:hypothetical protein